MWLHPISRETFISFLFPAQNLFPRENVVLTIVRGLSLTESTWSISSEMKGWKQSIFAVMSVIFIGSLVWGHKLRAFADFPRALGE